MSGTNIIAKISLSLMRIEYNLKLNTWVLISSMSSIRLKNNVNIFRLWTASPAKIAHFWR